MAIYRVQSQKLTPSWPQLRNLIIGILGKFMIWLWNYTSWDLLVQKKKKKPWLVWITNLGHTRLQKIIPIWLGHGCVSLSLQCSKKKQKNLVMGFDATTNCRRSEVGGVMVPFKMGDVNHFHTSIMHVIHKWEQINVCMQYA